MNQTDPRAVAKAEEIVSHLEGTEGFTECVNIIAHALADAERRGLERAAKVADDFDRLTCAEMERKYRLRIDVRRLNLGDNIARCIRAQAQADKEAPHGTDAE